jgi:hypothetical protein
MKVAVGLVSALALFLATLPSANAETVPERIFEFSPIAGVFLPDGNTNYKSSSPLVGVRAAINNSPHWGFEGSISYSPRQQQNYRIGTLTSYDAYLAYDAGGVPIGRSYADFQTEEVEAASGSDLLFFGGSAIYHLTTGSIRPFLSLGGGFVDDINGGSGPGEPGSDFSHPFGDLGGGVKLFRRDGWNVRVEAHDLVTHQDDLARVNPRAPLQAAIADGIHGGPDHQFGTNISPVDGTYDPFEHVGTRWLHNWAIMASVSIPLGWVWKDGDRDQVADRFDVEPTTPPNVVVDTQGRGIDSDKDGIFDGIDKCASTPLGATVDITGCPSDSDKDGILDGLDKEPATVAGASVDAEGRSADSDGDGVPNGIDLCDNTPKGTPIDEKGCAKSRLEEMLLRGDAIALSGVSFEGGTVELNPLSYHSLNKIGPLLQTWTTQPDNARRIELIVHPSRSESGGASLAQSRADAIKAYLLKAFPKIPPQDIVARGATSSPEGAGVGAAARVEIRATPRA